MRGIFVLCERAAGRTPPDLPAPSLAWLNDCLEMETAEEPDEREGLLDDEPVDSATYDWGD